jgi:hypothetical protein
MQEDFVDTLKKLFWNVELFAEHASDIRLRRYQVEAAQAIVDSVVGAQGRSFVVIFPRQSGKNELQAQVEAYLLGLLSEYDVEIVKVSPTWKPQSLNAMRRLERVLSRNFLLSTRWEREQGYIYRIGRARIFFLSGSPTTNVVGATANALLECDEAQDVHISKWDKDFSPMAASKNATRVFWGTAWTSRTLLARELRAAKEAERQDGIRRVFVLTADDVGEEVPAYKAFVAGEVAKLGRNHPLVRTQFFSEEIDGEGGMFPPARQSLMAGYHCRQQAPGAGRVYALLVDVAGEDEGAADGAEGSSQLQNPGRDATALTVVEVDLGSLRDELVKAPTYRVVDRRVWVGVRHTQLYGEIKALAEHWGAVWCVIDSTGVGAGIASFLDKALPGKVLPFVFSAASKTKLGWDFLAVVETGRFKDWARDGSPEQAEFWRQVELCQLEALPGQERRIKWGVPDGTRDAVSGELAHDDLVLSAALVAVLDGLSWGVGDAAVVRGVDPLAGLGDAY